MNRIVDLVLGLRICFWNRALVPAVFAASLADRVLGGGRTQAVMMWVLEERLVPLAFRRLGMCYKNVMDRIDYLQAGEDLR